MEKNNAAGVTDRAERIARLRMDNFRVPPDQDYSIALFRPEDAPGVARLTCSLYGDRHPFDYVYDPQEIARLFASDAQYAFVATSPRGEVLGMIGIYRCAPWPHLYELAQLMILPNQRGKGMANDLWVRAMRELPPQAKADVIFGEAVCTHTFSQRMCQETLMLPCGVALDAIPAMAYAETGQSAERTTLLLHAKVIRDAPQAVFMPERYRAAHAAHCAVAGLERTALAPEAADLLPTCEVDVVHFAQADCVKLWMRAPGRDLAAILAESEHKAGEAGIVQVMFDLKDARALPGIEATRDRGYFFGGFAPLWFGSDGLLLQRRKSAPAFAGIRLYNDAARYLVDLAERDWREVAPHAAPWGQAGSSS